MFNGVMLYVACNFVTVALSFSLRLANYSASLITVCIVILFIYLFFCSRILSTSKLVGIGIRRVVTRVPTFNLLWYVVEPTKFSDGYFSFISIAVTGY